MFRVPFAAGKSVILRNPYLNGGNTPSRCISRRDVLLQGSLAIAGLALLRAPQLAEAFSAQPGEEQFFVIAHYNKPVLEATTWRLQIGGLVQRPLVLTLDDLKVLPRQQVDFTLECSGNDGLPFFNGGASARRSPSGW